jgi:leucyl-tRNA synthetase
MLYYEAVKYAYHELTNAKDRYVNVCSTIGQSLNAAVVRRYVEVQSLLMSPIIPHFCDHVWTEVLGKVTMMNQY